MIALLIPLALAAAVPSADSGGVATLEAITIEGEVAVPRVLFITSRDHPRHREDLGGHLRPTALQIALGSDAPDRLVVLGTAPAEGANSPAKEPKP